MTSPTEYNRRPFSIQAMQVTQENIEEVANWSGGLLEIDGEPGDTTKFIKLNIRAVPRLQRAYVGDWVTYNGSTFRIYTDRTFRSSFDLPGQPQSRNVFKQQETAGESNSGSGSGSTYRPPSEAFRTDTSGTPVIEVNAKNSGGGGGSDHNPGGTRGV